MRRGVWSVVDCSEPVPVGALVSPPWPEFVPELGDSLLGDEVPDWSEPAPVEVPELEPAEPDWSEPVPVDVPELLSWHGLPVPD
ncbi:hypothetical protein [Amycolatopsis sp. NPDC051903]|uniref:hypothetical protein n=1 Tax=Amycolatopsis sp. NPDC051903 TaxID=3363936 RepID=UPI003797BF15